jgi:hypothetical protein
MKRVATLTSAIGGLVAVLVGLLLTPGTAVAQCCGDCNSDGHVTVDEILTMVDVALGNAAISTCMPGDVNSDQQITVDEILIAVNTALNGCPSSLAASPPGPIQVTSLVFSNVLPQLGTATFPSVDNLVSTAISQGLDTLLNQLGAAQPAIWTSITNGVQLNFGSGTPQPLGTLAGQITATYSNVTQTGDSISFDGDIHTEDLTLNGVRLPIANTNVSVNAAQAQGGTSTLNITLTGSGSNPPFTANGNVVMDTAKCPNYPVGGTITTTKDGTSATINFDSNCDGSFYAWGGQRQVNFLVTYYDCYYDEWDDWTDILLAENGHLSVNPSDLWEEDPPNEDFSGTVSDTGVNMSWQSKCRTADCVPTWHFDGTFVGRLWKQEQKSAFGLNYLDRYYIGTYTTHFVNYNDDGTVKCETTRVLNEEDGMNDYYHFIETIFE